MVRRVYTYSAQMGWATGNLLATIGAFTIAFGGVLFLKNVASSASSGNPAGDNPWLGSTLEWAVSSPPAPYNFARLPVVNDRTPLWSKEERTVVTGLRDDRREVLVTSILDAEPHHRLVLPSSSIWPFLTSLAIGTGFYGSVIQFWWYYVSFALGGAALIGWFWPRRPWEIEP